MLFRSEGECGGTGTSTYFDEYGQIIDVDLTVEDLLGGKTGKPSPLVSTELWTSDLFARAALGFLVVDQTKMDERR